MSGFFVVEQLKIVLRLTTIRHRPKQRVQTFRINVIVHGDDPAPGIPVAGGGGIKCAPNLGLRSAAYELKDEHCEHRSQWLVHVDSADTLNADFSLQVR